MSLSGVGIASAGSASFAIVDEAVANPWSFSLSDYTYLIPDGRNYTQPTFTADRGRFHFEARYNYEALSTGSVWLGCNFSAGDELTLEVTPMIGGVFGDTRGVAPGLELTLDWKKLSFYSETEYVIDSANQSDNFLYTWLELTYKPWDWLRAGLVAQRSRLQGSSLDVERGILVGLTWKKVEFITCVFFPGSEQPTVALGVSVSY
ncbi:MAG: hypothetical protein K8R87_11435 [Verrucomicrobia bacterium]|nr:hypothetical protein [Verrucomicrobiota bacterium]